MGDLGLENTLREIERDLRNRLDDLKKLGGDRPTVTVSGFDYEYEILFSLNNVSVRITFSAGDESNNGELNLEVTPDCLYSNLVPQVIEVKSKDVALTAILKALESVKCDSGEYLSEDDLTDEELADVNEASWLDKSNFDFEVDYEREQSQMRKDVIEELIEEKKQYLEDTCHNLATLIEYLNPKEVEDKCEFRHANPCTCRVTSPTNASDF